MLQSSRDINIKSNPYFEQRAVGRIEGHMSDEIEIKRSENLKEKGPMKSK